jgi:arylformamidase
MAIHDISLQLSSELPTWPGDRPPSVRRVLDLEHGDGCSSSILETIVHTGTHVDAPLHFLLGGKGVGALDLDLLVGPCQVAQVDGAGPVDGARLQSLGLPSGTTRLLLKTRNSVAWARCGSSFQPDFVALDPSGAAWIAEHGVRVIGIDYLSIATFESGPETHRILLEAGVIPVEGLDLSRVLPGPYRFVCLPLNLGACDGAPARAILIDP